MDTKKLIRTRQRSTISKIIYTSMDIKTME